MDHQTLIWCLVASTLVVIWFGVPFLLERKRVNIKMRGWYYHVLPYALRLVQTMGVIEILLFRHDPPLSANMLLGCTIASVYLPFFVLVLVRTLVGDETWFEYRRKFG